MNNTTIIIKKKDIHTNPVCYIKYEDTIYYQSLKGKIPLYFDKNIFTKGVKMFEKNDSTRYYCTIKNKKSGNKEVAFITSIFSIHENSVNIYLDNRDNVYLYYNIKIYKNGITKRIDTIENKIFLFSIKKRKYINYDKLKNELKKISLFDIYFNKLKEEIETIKNNN